RFPRSARVPFLVTGASGKVGRAMVARLRAQGHRVRVMMRRVPEAPQPDVEYAFGDLGDPAAVDRAVAGVEIVIHIGAATTGGWPEHQRGTVDGTRHVIDACTRHGVRQLVYLSSMSVIDWAGSAGHGPVTERANLEPRPDERGAYTRAKLEAERLVVAAARQGLPCVILRPGQIFGGGIPLINGAVARAAAGRWLILGDGQLELPLVYLDDVIDAIEAAVDRRLTGGEVIQIIDPEHLTQRDVLALAGSTRTIVAVPRALVFALGKLSEYPLRVLGRQSPIASYRLASALARLHYDSDRAASLLGWHPRIGVRAGIRLVSA
ncbi:MAG: NAD-dependent epimerase/dehydratase family protein, partial [Proteobacteria bacterium]|nr:NAD-dependent epimerase/dehydratase family protein [Pseudomonadota bacterium]